MSGETEVNVSGWTTDTLRYHLAQRVDYERQLADERDRRYQERWMAQETASKYAQQIANEFRGSLSDLSTQMATKHEMATAMDALNDKLSGHSDLMAEIRSRLDVGNPAVAALQNQAAQNVGLAQGSQITMAKIYGAIGAMGVILTAIVLLANGVIRG